MSELYKELNVTRQTLYRHVSPKGELHPDGLKATFTPMMPKFLSPHLLMHSLNNPSATESNKKCTLISENDTRKTSARSPDKQRDTHLLQNAEKIIFDLLGCVKYNL
ncbi:hypothetical protein [Xenorhabdus littoralis]|uniref:hypothetical protein n=1 Tax=Xenorhabdus littoralis TaxID=2582835 RepID=UPI003F6CDFC1